MQHFVVATACLAAFVALSMVATPTKAAITADQVTALPGWNKPLPSKHYSGLLPVLNGKAYLHYWLIESENNPSTDPLVVWLNGGPGSSSLIGLLTENGQFLTNDNSVGPDGNISLIYNPYSWSQVANILYVEQPKGVGFSYCVNNNDCVNNDSTVGPEFLQMLKAFFNGFPEYKSHDFYITGESYAGIYIPEIMSAIDKDGTINMKGAAIGDGCIGNNVSTCGTQFMADRISAEFYQGHGMYPQTLYNEIKSACGDYSTANVKCLELLAKMNRDVGNFMIYNIYDQCGNDQVDTQEVLRLWRETRSFNTSGSDSFSVHPQIKKGLTGALNDYACGGQTVMERWLSQKDVQQALHVSRQGVQMYHRTVADLRPTYKYLAQKYRMLIYSGSVDACVPYWGSEEWTRELGFAQKKAWTPWHSGTLDEPNQTHIQAGYVTTYDAGTHDFTFLTVSGAGHMVPTYRPVQALTMLKHFLNNTPYN